MPSGRPVLPCDGSLVIHNIIPGQPVVVGARPACIVNGSTGGEQVADRQALRAHYTSAPARAAPPASWPNASKT